MAYSPATDKTLPELESELRAVFEAYPEYSCPECGPADFDVMVRKFAGDNFYKLHLVARAYLELRGEAVPVMAPEGSINA